MDEHDESVSVYAHVHYYFLPQLMNLLQVHQLSDGAHEHANDHVCVNIVNVQRTLPL